MPQRLNISNTPHAYDTHAEFAGVAHSLYFRWNWRTGDWRLSIQRTSDSVWLAVDRRVSSGGILAEVEGGQLRAFGADPYPRNALGDSLYILYYTADDLATFANPDGSFDPAAVLVS